MRAWAPVLTVTPVLAVASVLAALGSTVPALAADMHGEAGPYKTGSYPAIPVPAPVPVPETFSWYVRGDIGVSVGGASPSFRETGISSSGYTSPVITETPSGWDRFGHIGVGAGRYFTRYFRGDATFEARTNSDLRIRGGYQNNYTEQVPNNPAISHQVNIATDDLLANRAYVGLLNGYVDIPVASRFTPYLGAGIGMVAHYTTRKLNETHTDTVTNSGVIQAPVVTGNGATDESHQQYGLAYALMAGTAIDLTSSMSLDLGYRFLHTDGGNVYVARPVTGDTNDPYKKGSPASTVSFSDSNVHELRAGVRYKIW